MRHSLKTASLETFKANLVVHASTSGMLFRHYHSSNRASVAFRTDQVRQSLLKDIVERTAPGALSAHYRRECEHPYNLHRALSAHDKPERAFCTPVVFVGAAYGGGTATWRHKKSKKYRGGPSCVKLLVRELAKFTRVVMTNEFQ